MQQSPSLEADIRSSFQEIPYRLWGPKIHYGGRKSQITVSILSQMNLALSPYLPLKLIYMSFSHLRLGLPSNLLPSAFITRMAYTYLTSPTLANHPYDLIGLFCKLHSFQISKMVREITFLSIFRFLGDGAFFVTM
jgi:hypothetical protein